MKMIFKAVVICLVSMYFVGCIAILMTSLAMAEFYWHKWWMCPVQVFVGVFLIVIAGMVIENNCDF